MPVPPILCDHYIGAGSGFGVGPTSGPISGTSGSGSGGCGSGGGAGSGSGGGRWGPTLSSLHPEGHNPPKPPDDRLLNHILGPSIDGRRLAFHIRVGGKNHLPNFAVPDPFHRTFDRRRNAPLDEMEASLEVASEKCPNCGKVSLFPGFAQMEVYPCQGCGELIRLADGPDIDRIFGPADGA